MALIEIKEVSKVYSLGGVELKALDKISLGIEQGEFAAIMGPSGSGKSTFMNMLGCLDRPTSGKYILEGIDVSGLDRDELALIRNQKLGFVFQGFNLLSRTSALENVELPLIYSSVPAAQRHARAKESLRIVGLESRLHHHPNQLSGGQQQRVAIARALINEAPIILADEPTGNLDSKTGKEIMDLFVGLNTQRQITIILVTHESAIAAYSKRVIRFLDGQIVNDGQGEHYA